VCVHDMRRICLGKAILRQKIQNSYLYNFIFRKNCMKHCADVAMEVMLR